jgi:hypothetical protein
MNFRKIILATTILLASQFGFSQDDDDDDEFVTQEIYTRYYAVGNYKLVDWNVDDFEKQPSYDIGYRISAYNMFLSLSYQHYHGISTPESLSNNVAIRKFDLYANSYAVGFGYYFIKSKFSLAPFVNINIGNAFRLQSTSVYVDGLASYGSENNYNGTYMDGLATGYELGILMKYKIWKNISIEIEPTYMWMNVESSSNLYDTSLYKTFANGGSGSGGGTELDVTDYLKAPKLMIGVSYRF